MEIQGVHLLVSSSKASHGYDHSKPGSKTTNVNGSRLTRQFPVQRQKEERTGGCFQRGASRHVVQRMVVVSRVAALLSGSS